MTATLSKHWWVFILRGVAAILLGIAVFIFPGAALVVVIALIAAYFLVDGGFTTVYAIQNRSQPRWWVSLLEGLISIAVGIGAILFPRMTVEILVYVVGFWAILSGGMEIIFATQTRKEVKNEWWIILSGILSIGFGIYLVLNPGIGLVTLLVLLGIYAIVSGVLKILFAFRVKGLRDQTDTSESAPVAS
jgi:uncharacterized membrane protein HdeD (DUF308 family)